MTNSPDLIQHPHKLTHNENDSDLPSNPEINGINSLELPIPTTSFQSQGRRKNNGKGENSSYEEEGTGPECTAHPNHHPNGGKFSPCKTTSQNRSSKSPLLRSHNGQFARQEDTEEFAGPLHNPREQQENVVLRRGFVPRTAPERVAQRRSSMAQLQQWVNQRRGTTSHDDINR